MNNIGKNPVVYWDKKVPNTSLEKFQKVIEEKYRVKFESYWDLHKWTVENYTKFWEEIWHLCGVISSKPYEKVFVKTGPGFLDNEWFSGARLNYTENVLRFRDDRVALICLDEIGNEETVTFAEMFEEVKLYASAFRKCGLKIGDRVACFMPNRKEPIFAMLAAASIGAIFGGPVPYYGVKAASEIITMMDPKFLITIDSHQDNGLIFPTLNYLPEIVQNAPTIEKVILVVTQEETYKKDLSNIRNCVFLQDFLKKGLTPEGKVPDIIFEQLPFNHPLCLNFTSGTTGLPKTAMHSVGSFLSVLRDFFITYDMKDGDIICLNYPVGWSMWDGFIPALALGLTLFLYCGSVYYTIKGNNFWDHLAKYKVKMATMITCMVDRMDKMQITPSPSSDMTCLKLVEIGGSPVKKENYEYLQTKVNKDLFVGNFYGTTELYGTFSGFNMNMPVYGGEIQVPSLGIDLQCFDSEGNSVIGQRGELVVCTPAVNFLIGMWKDANKAELTKIYLSKYPGVWTQHDECWINPKTRGIVIIGRSDETFNPKGHLFGASDIYRIIHSLTELQDYICVSQKHYNGDSRVILFVKMRQGCSFSPEIKAKIEKKIDEELWEDCVPQLILEVTDIPYNFNNKRMERLVTKIIENNTIPEVKNIRNLESLKNFVNIPEIMNYNKENNAIYTPDSIPLQCNTHKCDEIL